MSTYCFTTKDGQTVEREYQTWRNVPRRIKVDGKWAERDIVAEHSQRKVTRGGCATWPMKCAATGVQPDQIKEAIEYDHAHGVKTEYAPDGEAIYRTPAIRKAHARLLKLHDRNAGYSDPVPD